jgi:hypothetical protein
MPYSIDQASTLLRIRYSGRLTRDDVHASLDEVEALLRSSERWPDSLVDLRGIDIGALGFSDVMGLSKRRASVTPPNPIRLAIVSDQPSIVGFARMFQSLNKNPDITIQIFPDSTEAETWLQVQPPGA